jgi:hypothetical protein
VDEILTNKKKQEEVIKECLSADTDNGKSIILFASPQVMSKNGQILVKGSQLAIASNSTSFVWFAPMRFIYFALLVCHFDLNSTL